MRGLVYCSDGEDGCPVTLTCSRWIDRPVPPPHDDKDADPHKWADFWARRPSVARGECLHYIPTHYGRYP